MTALICVLVFWAAAAAVWPLSGSVVPWDSKNQFYPMLRYLGASLANGEWPLWNPYHFSGHPAVADPQSLLFTPTMLLFGWLDPSPSLELFDVVVFAHLLPGAFGIVGLFRRRGWHWSGAVIAAMIFVLGGSASSRLQHTGMIVSYGFFPLALLLLEEALARRSYRFGFAFALVALAMAIGRDQVAFLCCLTLIGAVAYEALSSGRALAYLRERALLLAFMGATGGALIAVPALLTVQFLSDSNRPSFGLDIAAQGSLPPSSLATLLFANIFGSLRTTYDYWGMSNGAVDRAVNYLFVGTLPALLLLWHGIAGGRLFSREFRFFLIVAAAMLIYAVGTYTPIYTLAFDIVPGLDLYRRPADATFPLNVALALASGYLVHRFVTEGLPRIETRRHVLSAALALTAIVLVVAALASGVDYAIKAQHLADALTDAGLGLAVAAAAAVLALSVARLGQRPGLRAALACGLIAITGGELIARNAASALNAEPQQRYAVYENLPPEQVAGLKVLKTELDLRHARGERPRVEILGLSGPWQNASMVFGLEDTLGYNPLRISDYERAVGPGENSEDPNLRQFPVTFRGYRCRLASLLGLEYLVLSKPIEKMSNRFPRLPNATLLYGAGSMWIYKMPPTMPRAYLATRLVPVDSESVLDGEELPDFDHTNSALIEESEAELLAGDYGLKDQTTEPAAAGGSVIIRGYRRNAIVIDVETDRNALLVLHDIYYPGWEVMVDGEEKRILRTNLLFRGVEIPPGRHRVRFEFKPLSVHNLVAAASELVNRDSEEPDEASEAPVPAGMTLTR
ncbi:hypothetical protein [Chelatococcus reniformis]|uniref:Membrane protein n=1 Tax=Chelatococcus reniformis TaxID=1494448 RepID=A0A916UFY4_9HYPH|nr:hypothetical protein [Chelatococcus reniformis]GGC71730.1 membrane protein [Chelatococcus reniformis]